MALTLNLSNTVAVSTSKPRLKPWEVHEVVLKSVEYKEIVGKKDPSKSFATIEILFEGIKGNYYHTIFEPQEGDGERRLNSNNKEMVSNFENFSFLIAQLGEICSPTSYAKLKGVGFEFGKPGEFKKFAEAFKKVMSNAFNKTFYLKLIGDKNNNPRLPYFVALTQEGEPWVTGNFISTDADNLFFSTFELNSKSKITTAAPTDMSTVSNDTLDTDSIKTNDLDFDL